MLISPHTLLGIHAGIKLILGSKRDPKYFLLIIPHEERLWDYCQKSHGDTFARDPPSIYVFSHGARFQTLLFLSVCM